MFIGVVSTPIIQHSEGKKSQGFGDWSPTPHKKESKKKPPKMDGIKRSVGDLGKS
jgi:hypothetical protein